MALRRARAAPITYPTIRKGMLASQRTGQNSKPRMASGQQSRRTSIHSASTRRTLIGPMLPIHARLTVSCRGGLEFAPDHWFSCRMNHPDAPLQPASRDPLHGVTLEMILNELVASLGWKAMSERVPIRCFQNNPSVRSSLVFLRKTPWARKRVESVYLASRHSGTGT